MSSHQDLAARTLAPSAVDDALGYWWPVCRGDEIMRVFLAAPEAEAWQVVERHPVLLLPELIDAAERTLGRTRALDGLREMHHALRGSPAYAPYHRLLVAALAGERRGSRRVNLERALAVLQDVRRALVRGLLDETAGEPRINADAALRLVSAHRRLDADPAWTALEAECSQRASGAKAGSA